MNTGIHALVSGRVQGVGFRWFVQQTARETEISGTVENLPNGDVEIFAEGEQSKIMEFLARVRIGPAYGTITDFIIDSIPFTGKFSNFKILH